MVAQRSTKTLFNRLLWINRADVSETFVEPFAFETNASRNSTEEILLREKLPLYGKKSVKSLMRPPQDRRYKFRGA